MINIGEIERRIDKLLAHSTVRVQSEVLNSLLRQVAEYVEAAQGAKDLASDIRSLEKEITDKEAGVKAVQKDSDARTNVATQEAYALQQEILQLEQTLTKAQQAEAHYRQSRIILKDLSASVEALRNKINKII